ncbi:MAG: histidinol-phosphate transaminase [Deltaproteobacteria bacterium RIFOXYD12_FULL_50_9]|nr:MAG: histidinol-phosphate transaminase [Deltaproteobacteria bacterium RIFOXYD12_FULL_50_9]
MKLNVPAHIASLIPYPPGKPLEELEREYGITGSIKLASNENALGPSPKAVAAIAANLAKLHRYPDGSCFYLANRLASHLGVDPAALVFGNGSNEIIGLLIDAFLTPGEEVITSHPTFLVYQKVVQARGGVNRVVALRDMRHDLEAILAEVTAKTRLIFLDNPNNPTGTVFGKEEFAAFLGRVPEGVIVVLDEAYVDFVAPAIRLDALDYINGKTLVVALRTFSKAYGLAGLRVGYGLMRPEMADYLHRVRQPFNVNQLAQIGALAALDDEEHYSNTLDMTRNGMAWLRAEIEGLGCRTYPSEANFFLVDVGRGREVFEAMLARGVIVRPMSAYGYPAYIRITVGLPAENQRLVTTLAATLQEIPR